MCDMKINIINLIDTVDLVGMIRMVERTGFLHKSAAHQAVNRTHDPSPISHQSELHAIHLPLPLQAQSPQSPRSVSLSKGLTTDKCEIETSVLEGEKAHSTTNILNPVGAYYVGC